MRNKTILLGSTAAALFFLFGASGYSRAQNPKDDRDKLYVPDRNYIQAPVPSGDEKYAHIDPAAIKKSEEEIVAIFRKESLRGKSVLGKNRWNSIRPDDFRLHDGSFSKNWLGTSPSPGI